MAGKVWDRKRLIVDRDPSKQLAVEVGRLKKTTQIDWNQHWLTIVSDFILTSIHTLTGIDIRSWDAFIASLSDGKGIDLPGFGVSLAQAAQAYAQLLSNAPKLSDLIELLSGQEDGDVTDVGTKWLEQQAKTRDMIDNFVRGLGQREGTGWALNDVFDVGRRQAREQAKIQAAVAQLKADQSGNNASGKSIVVAVSDYTGIPNVLTKFYDDGAGTVTNDGDTLEFSNNDGAEFFVYNVEPLTVDQGELSLIIPRHAGTYFGSYNNRCLYWIFRANHPTNPTTYTFARLNGDRLRWGCVRAGVSTIAAPEWFGPEQQIDTAGYMTAQFGTQAGGDRQFRMLANNDPVAAPVNDAAAVSLIGEQYRYFGLGIQNDANDIINRVANVSHIFANDNTPVAIQGVTFRAYRGNDAAATLAAAAPYGLPAGVLDTVDYTSGAEHFDWDPATQTLTLKVAGTYLFTLRAESAQVMVKDRRWQANIIRNGVLVPGLDIYSDEADTSNDDPNQMSIGPAVISIYCTTGTTIRPSLHLARALSPTSGQVVGGGRTYFSAVLLNNTVTGVPVAV